MAKHNKGDNVCITSRGQGNQSQWGQGDRISTSISSVLRGEHKEHNEMITNNKMMKKRKKSSRRFKKGEKHTL